VSGFENYRPEKEIKRRLQDEYAQRFSDACGAEKHSADLSPLRLRKRVETVIHGFVDSTRWFPLKEIEGPPENHFFEDEKARKSKKHIKANERGKKRLAKFVLSRRTSENKALSNDRTVTRGEAILKS
jgi:hypothetical protein